MANLIVRPHAVVSWEEFLEDSLPYSIGIDGYILDVTQTVMLDDGPRANYDHHSVDRLSVRSTAGQLIDAIHAGELDAFFDQDREINVYTNSCDQDVCLSVWMLNHFDYLKKDELPENLREFILLQDNLDIYSGLYEVDLDSRPVMTMAWIFEPYTDARISRRLQNMDSESMTLIISDVGTRITNLMKGNEMQTRLDTRHELLYKDDNIVAYRGIGAYARFELLQGPQDYFISMRNNASGRPTVTVARRPLSKSPPLDNLWPMLNDIDRNSGRNRWSGTNTVGGSPRGMGSSLNAEDIVACIKKLYD